MNFARKQEDSHKKIPKNCALWFDGCNTCRINNGRIEMCTKRMCLRLEEPSCREHQTQNKATHEKGRQCFDNKDNDHDGTKDCDDPDCKIYGRCRHVGGHEKGRQCFVILIMITMERRITWDLTASKIHGRRTIAKHKLRIKLYLLFFFYD